MNQPGSEGPICLNTPESIAFVKHSIDTRGSNFIITNFIITIYIYRAYVRPKLENKLSRESLYSFYGVHDEIKIILICEQYTSKQIWRD